MKKYEVNINKFGVYFFTYSYNKNESSINSPLIKKSEVREVEYLQDHVSYTLEPHYLASAMLSVEQHTEVSKLLNSNKCKEAYEYINTCSKIILPYVNYG